MCKDGEEWEVVDGVLDGLDGFMDKTKYKSEILKLCCEGQLALNELENASKDLRKSLNDFDKITKKIKQQLGD